MKIQSKYNRNIIFNNFNNFNNLKWVRYQAVCILMIPLLWVSWLYWKWTALIISAVILAGFIQSFALQEEYLLIIEVLI